MSGRVPLSRFLKLFQHLEKFQQHRVRGWHLPGPLLPPSEHHVPVPRANLLGASSAGASPSPLPHLPPIPGEGRMGGEKGPCLFKQLHAKPLPSCFI